MAYVFWFYRPEAVSPTLDLHSVDTWKVRKKADLISQKIKKSNATLNDFLFCSLFNGMYAPLKRSHSHFLSWVFFLFLSLFFLSLSLSDHHCHGHVVLLQLYLGIKTKYKTCDYIWFFDAMLFYFITPALGEEEK